MKKSDNIPLLEELKLELSYNCNLSCVHCSSEGSQDHRIKISIEKAKEIVKSSKELGVKTISLSGGEPYLWSGLTELANYTTNLGIKLNIYSSGSTNNFSRTTKNIKKDNVKLIFSLHGSNQELHEKISGIKGSFLKTIDSIDEATKLGFSCEVHFVPLRINYFDINSLVNLIKGFGIAKISILRFVPQGRGALNKDLVLTSEEFMTLRKNILHLRESGFQVRTGSPLNFLMLNTQPKCTSGIDKLTIAPDLSIYPCDAFKQVSSLKMFGHDEYSTLKKHSLYECWIKSKYLNLIREALNRNFEEPCLSCNYLESCKSGCLAQKYLNKNTLNLSNDPSCFIRDNQVSRGAIDECD